MPDARTIAHRIALVLFVCGIIWYMFLPTPGTKHFFDKEGDLLALGVCVTFSLGTVCMLIMDYVEGFYRVGRVMALSLIGTGFILLGGWMFGEKDRFATHGVTRTDATITRVSGYHYITLYYSYLDNHNQRHNGYDDVDMWLPHMQWRSIFYQRGYKVPINYLNDDPEVSHLVQQEHFDTYIAKGLNLLIGIGILAAVVYGRSARPAKSPDLDDFLSKENPVNVTPVIGSINSKDT